MLKKVEKKEADKPKKIQAMIPPSLYSDLASIKDYYGVSMNRVVNEALHDFAKRQQKKIQKDLQKKEGKTEQNPDPVQQEDPDGLLILEDPEEPDLIFASEYIKNAPLEPGDPLPPLEQLKELMENYGLEADPMDVALYIRDHVGDAPVSYWQGWARTVVFPAFEKQTK